MTPDTPNYPPTEARKIIGACGAVPPSRSTLRRRFGSEMSLTQIVAVVLERGGTLTVSGGIVYPYGVGGGVWMSPRHRFGGPAIEGSRYPVSHVWNNIDAWMRDFPKYPRTHAAAALRFRQSMKEVAP